MQTLLMESPRCDDHHCHQGDRVGCASQGVRCLPRLCMSQQKVWRRVGNEVADVCVCLLRLQRLLDPSTTPVREPSVTGPRSTRRRILTLPHAYLQFVPLASLSFSAIITVVAIAGSRGRW